MVHALCRPVRRRTHQHHRGPGGRRATNHAAHGPGRHHPLPARAHQANAPPARLAPPPRHTLPHLLQPYQHRSAGRGMGATDAARPHPHGVPHLHTVPPHRGAKGRLLLLNAPLTPLHLHRLPCGRRPGLRLQGTQQDGRHMQGRCRHQPRPPPVHSFRLQQQYQLARGRPARRGPPTPQCAKIFLRKV